MKSNKITAVVFSLDDDITKIILSDLNEIKDVEEIIVVTNYEVSNNIHSIKTDYPFSGETIRNIFNQTSTKYLILIYGNKLIHLKVNCIEKYISEAEKHSAGLVYSDYNKKNINKLFSHSLINYQAGSIRDDFNFGQCLLINIEFGISFVKPRR